MRDDEGCLGNPPPASAYFSPRSDQYSIPVSSRTKRADPSSPCAASNPRTLRATLAALAQALSPLCHSSFSLRASPRARYCRPSQTNPLALFCSSNPSSTTSLPRSPRHLAISFSVYLRPFLFVSFSLALSLSVCVSLFLSCCLPLSLFFSTSTPSRQPDLLIFRCNAVLKVSSILFIYQSRSSRNERSKFGDCRSADNKRRSWSARARDSRLLRPDCATLR